MNTITGLRPSAGLPNFDSFRRRVLRRTPRRALAVAAAATSVVLMSGAASATQPSPSTNDQSTTIATPWWTYAGVTASQVSSALSTNKARLTEIRVQDPATPTFAVTMVANKGPYGSAYWWYYGLTAAQLSSDINTNKARLISLSPYVVGGNVLFAAVMVPNSGAQGRAWWWYYGQSGSSIATTLSTNDARLVSLQPYKVGATTEYAVIEISNSGGDFADGGWSWALNQSPAQITASLHANSARLIALAADPGGGFDAIYLASEGEYWSWYFGLSASTLVTNISRSGERLIDITQYFNGRTTVYAGVGLDNSNPLQKPLNSASTRVQKYANANGWGGGLSGAYLARVTKPASPLVAYNSGYRYEPASGIKILYLVYALHRVQLGKDSLKKSFTYYVDPSDPNNSGVCPNPAWQTPANARKTTLGQALQLMMYNSDNRVTRGMEERYGIANVQKYARSLGMSHSTLAQPFIGCGFQGGIRNELTASDLAHLYAKIAIGKVLNPANTKTLFADELGGVPQGSDYLIKVIDQEAKKLGKSKSVAKSFVSHTINHFKGGSYGFCLASNCSVFKLDLSDAGVLTLPAKNSKHRITPVKYAYADFVNDLYILSPCPSGCAAQSAAFAMIAQVVDEAARGAIDSALKNW